jgi:hypothetical protein
MAKLKCILCDSEIEIGILNKPKGTIVKIARGRVSSAHKGVSSEEQNEQNKNEDFPVCSSCQKKHKDNLKKEVEKLLLPQK